MLVPAFMADHITPEQVTYLNALIPTLHTTYRELLFPILDTLPAFVVVNTYNDTLIAHGAELITPEVLGTDEALTLFEAQYLLATTRFGSVATPHRGLTPDTFGQLVYLKQHPVTGYRTPDHLLLEELLHVQQDITIMRHIITQDDLPPQDCMHAHLKGISELAAHYITDELSGEADYLFLLDDGTMCESAAHAVKALAERLDTSDDDIVRALLYDVAAYSRLDALALRRYDRHPWEMVTTWRHVRDETGAATGIAPAFIHYDDEAMIEETAP
ncbi:MAG: hypothetical protein AAF125_10520 [Chloroflexota bacterium]